MNKEKRNLKNGCISILKKIKRTLKNVIVDSMTIPYLIKANRRDKIKGRKIKIAFMCQYIPAWNSLNHYIKKC